LHILLKEPDVADEPGMLSPELKRELQARLRSARRRGRPGNRRSELERLVDLTVLGSTHPELGTCWLFTGTTTPYGRIAKAQDTYTHRLGWKLLRGPIPEGKELHHLCGVYACWNPDHLEPVTHAENHAYRRKARPRATARPRRPTDVNVDLVVGSALPERFWKKVNKNGPVPALRPELGPCWLHEGTPEKATGYVRCEINRVRDYVHRFVYRVFVAPIPDGKEIDHQCHNADPFLPERRILPAPTLCEPGPSRGCHAPRELEPEPKQHRHQEPTQDALPAWTPVRPGQHAGDAAWRSSLPGLQPCSAETVPGTVQDSPRSND
jgi:hypothetical protein